MAENKVLSDEDIRRFSHICDSVKETEHMRCGIGTYKEKSVHLALKTFFEPEPENREVPHLGFIADIKNSTGIHEIQTSGFTSIRRKLEAYFSDSDPLPVELIYPVIRNRRVIWIDPDSGEVVREYKSPRHIREAEILKELLYLGETVYDRHLSITIVTLEAEELRLLDGIDKTKTKRATRVDTVPTALIDIKRFSRVFRMSELFPYEDGELLSSERIRSYLRAGGRSGWAAMKIMEELGIIERCGKDGRRILYKFNKNPEES